MRLDSIKTLCLLAGALLVVGIACTGGDPSSVGSEAQGLRGGANQGWNGWGADDDGGTDERDGRGGFGDYDADGGSDEHHCRGGWRGGFHHRGGFGDHYGYGDRDRDRDADEAADEAAGGGFSAPDGGFGTGDAGWGSWDGRR